MFSLALATSPRPVSLAGCPCPGSVAGNELKLKGAWPELQLGSDTEEARDGLRLPRRVFTIQSFDLPLPHHVKRPDAFNRSLRGVERAEALSCSPLLLRPNKERLRTMDHRVQVLIEMMKDDLRQELTLDAMARSVNLTRSHLCRVFKSETGGPPARYLKRLRMQRARELLETTHLSIKEIVNRVGMRDDSHFVRDFRAAYGVSPTKYRARYRTATRTAQNPPTKGNFRQ